MPKTLRERRVDGSSRRAATGELAASVAREINQSVGAIATQAKACLASGHQVPNSRSPRSFLANIDNLRPAGAEERIGGLNSRAACQNQQKPPRRIKFLQERPDRWWDVHAIGQAFTFVCVTPVSEAGK